MKSRSDVRMFGLILLTLSLIGGLLTTASSAEARARRRPFLRRHLLSLSLLRPRPSARFAAVQSPAQTLGRLPASDAGHEGSASAPSARPIDGSLPTRAPARFPSSEDVLSAGTIQGNVTKMVGDFMPRTDGNGGGKILPLSARVFIYQGNLSSDSLPDKDDSRLVKIVRSDTEGKYAADLPKGTYTLFVEVGGQLYLNGLDGRGNWASVDLQPGKTVRADLVDNREATF